MKNPLANLKARTEQHWFDFKKFLALRRLESDLDNIIKIMTGHRNNKVPAGSSYYLALNKEARDKIFCFTEEFKVSFNSVYEQIPALKELEDLAYPVVSSPMKKIAYMPIVIIGVSMLILFFGLFTHFIQWLFTVGYNVMR